MTKRELIDYCLTFPSSFEGYPFDDTEMTCMQHSSNRKIFAFIYERNERLCINLKCDPMKADFLRQIYECVTAGWHMNKTHWNTVYVGGDVPEQELYEMIQHSYDLIKPKKTAK